MKIKNRIQKVVIDRLNTFISKPASSGFVLAMFAVIAMYVANSPWSTDYFTILSFPLFGLSVQHWINDGFMAIFFFVIGKEIKKVLVVELSTLKQAALPIAALGGHFFIQKKSNFMVLFWP
jgi:NhaA family Na+:H+ antiporter